ncbi:Rne/Rng family ribonuclease [Alloyangia pacifica]|uniref:Rne/Rng family ribonuclease n=1 Tax=Alloyangia pacifica TaxID=311180 RepID=UPI001CD57564|nr:ribonuclease E/G [Alloyangia pacifica]MCA0996521.1 Rne/Rng family ribonuclease [Alloyangia pacifica]
MAKKMLIDATHAEETRVVVVDGNKVEEFDFESENKRQLAGNIYLAKVTRVEPSLQAAFVDYGGNRHGFLAFSEIHPDYYQIPVADRQALMEEEAALAAEDDDDDKEKSRSKSSRSRTRRSRSRSKAEKASTDDKTVTGEVSEVSTGISGMETIDLGDDTVEPGEGEGLSPMETVAETPVEEPNDGPSDSTEADAAAAEAEVVDTPETDAGAPETEAKAPVEDDDEDHDDDHVGSSKADDSIESVADDDTEEDIRPARKPRPRKYKIQEVIKVRQILLVQVVKEERGNKGAALTTYLSLAGRYCVLMPNTARGGGISRKITNAADRSKLKEIAQTIDVPKGAGLIIRTAGAKRTKTEIKRDYEYLQRLWEQIRELTLKSVAPAKIYEEGDLIKRSIRDLYNREIDEVHVEGERGYRIAKDFMKMIMPSHAKNVKHYLDPMPLFARYQVESYLAGMFNPTVQLKSGGYIVIGVTEALVAIDVNSGRATKEGSIEETALKTNLEAAEEVARQLRLRDLAGLIVIDFIDMEERKNNAAVEKKLKDKLKTDRARIQVGRISGFGLLEMSRQRLRPGMIEATTQPCAACHGTGLIRSDDNMALNILRQVEEEGVRRRSREVLVKCPVGIANYLMNQKREHVAQIEARYGMAVRIEGDLHLVSPDFTMEKFKTATRNVPEVVAPVVSATASLMDQVDEDVAAEEDEDEDQLETQSEDQAEDRAEGNSSSDGNGENGNGSEDGDGKPKKRRRRRRRSRSKNKDAQNGENGENGEDNGEGNDATPAEVSKAAAAEAVTEAAEAATEEAPAEAGSTEAATEAPAAEEAPAEKPKRTRRSRSRKKAEPEATEAPAAEAPAAEVPAEAAVEAPAEPAVEAPAPEAAAEDAAPAVSEEPVATEVEAASEPVSEAPVAEAPVEPQAEATPEAPAEEAPVAETPAEPEPEPQPEPEPVSAEPVQEEAPKPKRRGWWSR